MVSAVFRAINPRSATSARNLGGRVVVTAGIRGDERLIVNPSDALVSGVYVEVNGEAIAQR